MHLSKPSANCTHRHQTAVHLLYPIPYANIYIQYILLPPPTCFSVPTPLTPVTVTLVCSVYPLNWSCLYHVFTTGCLYIYYVHLPNAGYVQHLLFPFPFYHTTLPPSPLPISTRPTSSRWVPPYAPWFCLRFLPD